MTPLHHERMGQCMETESKTGKRRIVLWRNYLKIPAQCQALIKPRQLQVAQGIVRACRYHKTSLYADMSDEMSGIQQIKIIAD